MSTLTPLEKWSYAVGNMPFAIKDVAFTSFVVFYYTQVQGLSGTLTGVAMFIALSWDAITDPFVGSWSDTIRSRWGRRHPLLLLGGVPTAVLCFLLFVPPVGLAEAGTFLWLLVVSLALRTFITIYFIPYSAMGAELSSDYDERTEIAKTRISMSWLASMLMPAIAFAVIFRAEGGVDGRLVEANYFTYGLVSFAAAGVTALICLWGTRTVIPRLPTAPIGQPAFHLAQPIADFRSALGNRNFRYKLGASLTFGMVAGVYLTLSLYLATYFWEFSNQQLAGMIAPTALGTVLAFSGMGWLGLRYDKPALLTAAAIALAVNAFWMIGARLLGLLPENGHPLIYPLAMISTCITTVILVGLQTLSVSLIADILDEQELATGRRQEGTFFAAGTFILKATTGVGTLIAGVVIDLAGIESGSAPGSVPQPVLQSLGWFTLAVVCGLCLVACWFYSRIRLGRKEHSRIMLQLEQNRAAGGVFTAR
ncbi:MAG: MFS transporter [Gammaproteobacteria bacterium]|nr:MFS transporter [Gammaproteobacteria bacterium]